MNTEEDELGFIVEEDQSEQDLPSSESWQDQYNRNLRESWIQGFKARSNYEGMKVSDNPYVARGGDDLVVVTRALGWEDGFLAAERGEGVDDCPYPES